MSRLIMMFQPNTNEYLLKNNKKSVYAGNHGFDNEVEDMRSIFVAKGPSKYHDNITYISKDLSYTVKPV